ncbi:MAG: undecaprenyl-diphosphate phosphatase [Oscillospiraceae bacterium]|nr:undecaprenyl-diphosphate phosphatase [Oscillospiraceae bacterium]
MSILNAVILAVIQGLSEFIPISSSGHLSLAGHILSWDSTGELSASLFIVVLHIGTLISVFAAFHRLILSLILELARMLRELFTGKFTLKNRTPERNMILMLLLACLPLIPVYPFNSIFKAIAEERKYIIVLGLCFLFTSVLLFLSDRVVKGKKRIGEIKARSALTVGVFQALALFPGISRSGATISSGLFCGFSRETAVQFSFVLSIPAILGGALSEISGLSKTSDADTLVIFAVIIGLIVSAAVGFGAIMLVKLLLRTNKFIIFSIYTAIVGLAAIIYGISRSGF